MTHYQKLATMIFRLLGVIVLIAGILLLFSTWLITSPLMSFLMILKICLPYLIGGVSLFTLSKFLAKLVCFDLDKNDE